MTRGMTLTYELVASPISLGLLAYAMTAAHRAAYGDDAGGRKAGGAWSAGTLLRGAPGRTRSILVVLVFVHVMWNIELYYGGWSLGRFGGGEFALRVVYGFVSHLIRPAAWMFFFSFALVKSARAEAALAHVRLGFAMLLAALTPEFLLVGFALLPGIDPISLQGLKNTSTVFLLGAATAIVRGRDEA